MRIRQLVIICLVLWFGPVAASEIYRWVDEHGQVHFGERPREGAQRVEVRPQVVERDAQVRQREQNLQRLMDVRTEERAARQTAVLEQRARQQSHCDALRRELARFDGRVLWYEEDANGTRVEVEPKRVEARKNALQAEIRERC
ncbi:DUF4124 domain-containing protein [Pseudomonas jilinensis]|uniref:DUF4124 domain-containing protein n=1 Tax=Pseudomonas jilinensis TaxID=2078689 RepID=A0A396RZD4_9PSED|nr:DUF4124 domain-containing protein [Pseudomonas jilinensis]RHW21988.1 DUF4124 domain-containing protein [Pseudomonas jilinensis]